MKKIKQYIDFLKENKGAGKMMIFYSDAFRDILTRISTFGTYNQSEVARFLLAAEESNQALDTFSLIDKTDKNDMISYAQSSRLQREYGIPAEELPQYKVGADDKFWKQGRTPQYGIGRWVRHVYSDVHGSQIENSELEAFVNAYKSTYDIMAKGLSGFELVKGEDIRKWYLDSNYEEVSGQLGNSCMRYRKCQPYLDIYVENPEVCQLLVLKGDNPDKIIGRALIWTLSDGNRFMDRIYTIKDSDKIRFENWARENGLFRDFRHTSGIVKVKPGTYDYYPYMDSFEYYIPESGKLSDAHSPAALTLKNTDGTGGEQGVWSDYHNEYIDEEDARWCEDVDTYVHYDSAVWLDYKDCYVSDNADTVYSEHEDGTFYRSDTRYSECMDDYLCPEQTSVVWFKTADGDADCCAEERREFYVEADGERLAREGNIYDPYEKKWVAVSSEEGQALKSRLSEELSYESADSLQRSLRQDLLDLAPPSDFMKDAQVNLRWINRSLFDGFDNENIKLLLPGIWAWILGDKRLKEGIKKIFTTYQRLAYDRLLEDAHSIAKEMEKKPFCGDYPNFAEKSKEVYDAFAGARSYSRRNFLENVRCLDLSELPDLVYKKILLLEMVS